MATLPPLGIKRICPHCGAPFYDLNRRPALCPKCGKEHDPAAQLKARKPRRAPEAPAPKPKPKPRPVAEEAPEEFAGAEAGSDMEELEEADDIGEIGELDEIEEEEEDEETIPLDEDEADEVLVDNLDEDEDGEDDDEEKPRAKAKSKKKKSK